MQHYMLGQGRKRREAMCVSMSEGIQARKTCAWERRMAAAGGNAQLVRVPQKITQVPAANS